MRRRATLVASLTGEPDEADLRVASAADVLEVRADLAGDLDPEWLRGHFSGRLLYTLRSRAEGGRGPEDPEERHRRLAAAAKAYDLVDLEGGRDLAPALLEAVPESFRLLSWHGGNLSRQELRRRAEGLLAHRARHYKIVPSAESAGGALAVVDLLGSLEREDVTAFASGDAGFWTRLVAPHLGAPLIFGALGEPAAPGQPSLELLREDYGLPELPRCRHLFGVAGQPVLESLSPRIHNAGYRELGLSALYVPFDVGGFGDFWLRVVEGEVLTGAGLVLRGLSVTAPCKEVALAVAGAASPLAMRVGSANTLVRRDGVWEAETTDPDGVIGPLRQRGLSPAGRTVAVIGAGGAGRAAAFALRSRGARVALVNRGEERLRRVAGELAVEALPWRAFEPGAFDWVVNATPLGRDADETLPFPPAKLAPRALVLDLAYRRDRPSRLIEEVLAVGRQGIDGREILLYQAVPQFRVMTGHRLPGAVVARALGGSLPPGGEAEP